MLKEKEIEFCQGVMELQDAIAGIRACTCDFLRQLSLLQIDLMKSVTDKKQGGHNGENV